ncbi:MAG: electron transporter RnfB [Acidiferrobacteraceae bacterium]|jgi:electron transport complex protein RnfB|nr:electron transporter RnfB [Acidiferrobacteraceae bacterium]MDP6950476.1 RnfABCDGE type electron transport complex subunit B [Arenicellales bacterium]HJP07917.1 RnfABCDGE type electron transport complex subunit B [Arenicellales bacterium]|tara:strand:+ start:10963 stop:11586 length:624 start_codon:yes stop_codon:yes gene_type:complete
MDPPTVTARLDAFTIDARLPQTQCRRCGFESCHAYAQAIVDGATPGNRCAPGGAATLEQLNNLTGAQYLRIDPDFDSAYLSLTVTIVEELCIGCTLCIQACPVDAILGSAKLMHTVIAKECSGCELCLPVCPVDCVVSTSLPKDHKASAVSIDQAQANRYRSRFSGRQARLAEPSAKPPDSTPSMRVREIAQSVARVRKKRATTARI